jgi:hypothetical protein
MTSKYIFVLYQYCSLIFFVLTHFGVDLMRRRVMRLLLRRFLLVAKEHTCAC